VIPLWGWLVIWTCLALALLAVLAVSVVRLFRKGLSLLDEFEGVAAKTVLLERAADSVEERRTELAIRAGAESLRRSRALIRDASRERKAARRTELIEQAKIITRGDPSAATGFNADDQTKPTNGGTL